jgi:hypothetical protein
MDNELTEVSFQDVKPANDLFMYVDEGDKHLRKYNKSTYTERRKTLKSRVSISTEEKSRVP